MYPVGAYNNLSQGQNARLIDEKRDKRTTSKKINRREKTQTQPAKKIKTKANNNNNK